VPTKEKKAEELTPETTIQKEMTKTGWNILFILKVQRKFLRET